MDSFSPTQYRQVQRIWRKYKGGFSRRHESYGWFATSSHTKPYSEHVVQAVIALNVGGFIAKEAIIARAIARARNKWTVSLATSVDYLFSSTKSNLTDYRRAMIEAHALHDFSTRWMLTRLSYGLDHWHTWITSNFQHKDIQHLIPNMMSCWCFGKIVGGLPGMNPFHMCAITLGSSIATSAAVLYQYRDFPRKLGMVWVACGSSGIVSALGAIAALGAPFAELDIGLPVKIPTLLFIVLQVTSDFTGVMTSNTHRALTSQPEGANQWTIAHTGHLGGAAFGALYYLLVLWPSSKRSTHVERPRSPRRLRDIDEETVKARRRNEARWLGSSSTASSSSSERGGTLTPDSD